MRNRYSSSRPWVRLVTALLVVVAIAAQCQQLSSAGIFHPVNVFSFFTIQSNVLAALTLLGLEFGVITAPRRLAEAARPAVVLYMSMTGIVYAVLLAPAAADVGLTAKWVDAVVHVIAPLVVAADWFLAPPERRPETADIPRWLIFPVLWLVYSLLRGALVNWYPYPFLDPRPEVPNAAGSAIAVTLNCIGIAVCVVAFAVALVALTRRVTRDVRP
ncbi:MAG: hypothetical protein RJA49_1050 [Actinomycetota bacterium]